jgi:predicted deacylase
MSKPFDVCGQTVAPGTRVRIDVPLGRLVTQQMLDLPLLVVHGTRAGPAVWLSAAIHGDEVLGTEVIRQVLGAISPGTLRGTILAMPVVNVWGFVQQSRYFPDRRDLNRCFPGSARGSLASRIAHLLMGEIVSRCDYGIDLHAGSHHRTNVPQARGNLDDPRVAAMCEAFGAPFTLHAKLRAGSLRHAAAKAGVPCLLYEAGEPHRFEASAVAAGRVGVLRVLRHLRMIAHAPRAHRTRVARKSHWMRAGRSGLVHLEVGLGASVRAGDTVAVIRDPYGDVAARMRARTAGAIIAVTLNPVVNRGDAVAHVAHVAPVTQGGSP